VAIVHGYCTLAQLKVELGLGDTEDDSTLERIITSVSREIENFCGGRRFYALSETRYYTARWDNDLLVDDVLTVSSLATDQDGDRIYETVWATTDYDLYPLNATLDGGPYWKIGVAPNGNYWFPAGVPRGVKLTGSFGYATTTPAEIEQACLFQSALAARAKDSPTGVIGGGEFQTQISAIGLHPFTKRQLESYRRISLGV
jgi:Phage gp6-like head-tail connector protein